MRKECNGPFRDALLPKPMGKILSGNISFMGKDLLAFSDEMGRCEGMKSADLSGTHECPESCEENWGSAE